MKQKQKNVARYYNSDDKAVEEYMASPDLFDYSEFDSLKKFTGTHPRVMQKRIAAQNWKVELDISQKKFSFKDRLLFWIEKITGARLFDFKNYKLIK